MEECCKLKACNFTKSNIPPWVFFTFFKLYNWYQIAQRITNSPLILLNPVCPTSKSETFWTYLRLLYDTHCLIFCPDNQLISSNSVTLAEAPVQMCS